MKKRKDSTVLTDKDEAFEREFQETDFGLESPEGVLVKAADRRGRPRLGRKFNVVMPEELIARIAEAGRRRGLGYQTMVRMICAEKVAEYLENGESNHHTR